MRELQSQRTISMIDPETGEAVYAKNDQNIEVGVERSFTAALILFVWERHGPGGVFVGAQKVIREPLLFLQSDKFLWFCLCCGHSGFAS
jgi:hypothetical protein